MTGAQRHWQDDMAPSAPDFDFNGFMASARAELKDYMSQNLDKFVDEAVANIVAPVAANVARLRQEQGDMKRQLTQVGSSVSNVNGKLDARAWVRGWRP